MSLSNEQMDAAIEEHFRFEATDDVEGVLATLADGAAHEVVPSPVGMLRDREKIRAYYEMLFECLKGEKVTPIRRLYGEGFVVDETLWEGEIVDGHPFLCDGKSGRVSFRLLHVFEFEGGKIGSEAVWCNLAAIQRQLDAR